MSTKISVLTAAGLLILSPAAFAATDSPAKSSGQTAPVVAAKSAAFDKADAAKIKMVVLTGSNIPQKATKAGRLPDTAQPLTVITGEEIEHSGATTVAGALRRMVPQIH